MSAPTSPPLVHMRGITKTFTPKDAPEVPVLHGIDLQVHAGETVALVGRSGSGKSTLLTILGLLDVPSGGTYELLGRDVSELKESERDRVRGHDICFFFQAFHRIEHVNVLRNIILPMEIAGVARRDRLARARVLGEDVGLGHRLDALPRTLSGGEQQRTAIARALVGDPALLLCDAPTGSLDARTGQVILEHVRGAAARGCGVVIVTHDPEVAAAADRQVHIRDGVLA